MKPNEDIYASVDLGSNSFRLQICQNNNTQPQVIDSIKEMVQLAAGLDDKKNLDKDAMARALACLERFGERLRGFKKSQVRAVATNTFRVARNAQTLLEKAEKALGFPIEIIGGREEARLIYLGVAHTLPSYGEKTLVVDIGGGSTEFIIGSDLTPDITESLALGCVSYSMRFFPKDKINSKNFRLAINTARGEIQRIGHDLRAHHPKRVIGTSGSARAIRDLIQVTQPLQDNLHYADMRSLSEQIIKAGGVKAAKFKGLKSARTTVFSGGLAVMMAVFEELNIEEMTVIDAALRDGVFYDLIGRNLNQDMRDETVQQFQTRYHVDHHQSERVMHIALHCLQGLALQMNPNDMAYWQRFITWAAQLHEIGLSIAHTGYHKHSAYIIENADMPGFSRRDQHVLSTLVLGHRGDLGKMKSYLKEPFFSSAMMCLRLAALFCRARRPLTFPEKTSLQFNTAKKRCIIKIHRDWLKDNPLTAAALDQEAEAWHKVGYEFTVKS